METARKNYKIPEKLYLGGDFDSYIQYINNSMTFFPSNQAKFMIDTDGVTLTDTMTSPQLILARPTTGNNPILLADAYETNDLTVEGFIIDNSYGDFDYRMYLPKLNDEDAVFWNGAADNPTAILKLKKNPTPNADEVLYPSFTLTNNVFARFTFGDTIFDSGSDYDMGVLMNLKGPITIAAPNNSGNCTAGSALNTANCAAIVKTLLSPKLLTNSNTSEDYPGFYATDVITAGGTKSEAYYAVDQTTTASTALVSQDRLFPILWAAVQTILP